MFVWPKLLSLGSNYEKSPHKPKKDKHLEKMRSKWQKSGKDQKCIRNTATIFKNDV